MSDYHYVGYSSDVKIGSCTGVPGGGGGGVKPPPPPPGYASAGAYFHVTAISNVMRIRHSASSLI
jgi:hypothetical protein